jgi:hypothetical protein
MCEPNITFDHQKCLDFDALGGDEGERTILSDIIRKARKEHVCAHCNSRINPGEEYRALSDNFDGELATYKYCATCCELMSRICYETSDEALDAFNARDYRDFWLLQLNIPT